MNGNDSDRSKVSPAAHWGGTIVAVILGVIVLAIASIVGGGLFALMQYYMSSMRAEAANFIGVLAGGAIGTYSARVVCDAVVKSYSQRTVYVVFMCLAAIAAILEITKGLDWQSVSRLGQWVVVGWIGWGLFWKGEPI